MKTIHAHFQKFNDVSLYHALDSIGVYVIWDSKARVQASYIGVGNVIDRLGKHSGRFSFPLDGYVAFFDKIEDAHIVEALIIEIAKDTSRGGTHNKMAGHWSLIKKKCKNEKLKVFVKGNDPLKNPSSSSSKLSTSKIIEADLDEDGDAFYESSHWHSRSV